MSNRDGGGQFPALTLCYAPAARSVHVCNSALPPRDRLTCGSSRLVMQALQTADVAVVSGDTGCGKTTQVRQLTLEMY